MMMALLNEIMERVIFTAKQVIFWLKKENNDLMGSLYVIIKMKNGKFDN